MHLLHFLSPVYYQAEEIASVSYSLIKKWKSISPFFSPLLIFFFISFMPRNAWWTSFAYVKLQRSILLSAAWIFLPDALWWVCMFLDIVCVCFLLCAFSCLIMYLALFSCLQCLSRCIPGACHAWPVHGAASGTRTTTPAPTWATPWLAPTLSSTVRLVLPRVNASGACGGGECGRSFTKTTRASASERS